MAGKNSDETLIATLAGGSTVQAAAQLCEVSERTIFRRLKDPTFRRRLQQARGDMLERALGHLAAGAADAAVTLRKLMKSRKQSVQLAASRLTLELGQRLREATDVEERLRTLEERLRGK